MCCGQCIYWVNDDEDNPDDYTHERAVKQNKGFCIFELLFTNYIASDKACGDFVAYIGEK